LHLSKARTKRSRVRPTRRWEDNIKKDIQEIGVIVHGLFNDVIGNSGCLLVKVG
jgi:hypothetical protein